MKKKKPQNPGQRGCCKELGFTSYIRMYRSVCSTKSENLVQLRETRNVPLMSKISALCSAYTVSLKLCNNPWKLFHVYLRVAMLPKRLV